MSSPDSSRGALWRRLTRPSAEYSAGALLAIGIIAGVIFWGGFNTAMEWTNSEKFCISCHEMYDNVYVEYQETIHFNNRTGVRATCADCHVPREWGPKMVRKVQASRELWGKLTGSIDTREKFEDKRLTLARREWKRMLANDSLECRNCHGLESMDMAKQATRSSRQHQRARDEGITCIVCHQGIAHHLPDDMADEDYLDTLRPAPTAAKAQADAGSTTVGTILDTASPTAAAPGAAPVPAQAAQVPTIDWSQVQALEVVLLYPGIAHTEWITGDLRIGRDRHGGGWAFKNGETCYACHVDETERMGGRIVTGAKLEPTPIPGKVPAVPVQVQAALDDEHLHLRFSWTQPPAAEGEKMDVDNPVKLAFMLDAGKVEGAERNGCWASCHADSRGMPGADEERTKYVKGGSLQGGVFYDLVQWRSGGNRGHDGHVADTRVMEGGSALVEATGVREGDTWTVAFIRRLAGGDGDIRLVQGETYNFGFAIHDGHTAGRFHHVSLGYTLGIDTGALITARRQ